MGIPCQMLSTPVVTIIDTQSMAIHDAVSAGFAPTPSAAARITATDPPKPTMTATKAEIMTELRILISFFARLERPATAAFRLWA